MHSGVAGNDADVSHAVEDMGYEDHITEMGTEWADKVVESADHTAAVESDAGSSSWADIVKAGAEHLAKANPGDSRDSGASNFVILPNQSSHMIKQGSRSGRSRVTQSVHGGKQNPREG